MVLRRSRTSRLLTKQSSAAGAVGKAGGKVLGAVGQAIEANPMLALALTGGAAGAASFAIPDIKRGLKGMDPDEMVKQRWGLKPRPKTESYHIMRKNPKNWFQHQQEGGGPVWR